MPVNPAPRRELEHLSVHHFGFCISTRPVIDISEGAVRTAVERITGERRAKLPLGVVPTAERQRELCGHVQQSRIRWIDGKGTLQFGLRGRPVPVQHVDPHELGMRFRRSGSTATRAVPAVARVHAGSGCQNRFANVSASIAHAMP
jgi:hypothetical protein